MDQKSSILLIARVFCCLMPFASFSFVSACLNFCLCTSRTFSGHETYKKLSTIYVSPKDRSARYSTKSESHSCASHNRRNNAIPFSLSSMMMISFSLLFVRLLLHCCLFLPRMNSLIAGRELGRSSGLKLTR